MTARGVPNGQVLPWSNPEQRHPQVASHRPPPDYAHSNVPNVPDLQPRFPHIKDLQAKANLGHGFNPLTPVSTHFASFKTDGERRADVVALADTYTFGASAAIGKSSECKYQFQQARSCLCRIPAQFEYPLRDHPTSQGLSNLEF